jgi:hypothetical protein
MGLTNSERADLSNWGNNTRQAPRGSGMSILTSQLADLDKMTRLLARTCLRLDDELRILSGKQQ